MRLVILVLFLAPLTACDDSAQQETARTATARAVTDAICAQTRDDLELALASVASEAAAIDEPVREDTVSQLAGEVVCEGQRPR